MNVEQVNSVGVRVLRRLEKIILEELATECPWATMDDAQFVSLCIGANIFMNCAEADRTRAVALAKQMLSEGIIAIPS